VSFFLYSFLWWGRVRKADCLHLFKRDGWCVSGWKEALLIQLLHICPRHLSCSYFGNADATLQLYEIFVWKQKTAKNTLSKEINSLHVYYASLNKHRNPPEASWSTWEDFRDNSIHSNTVSWAYVSIWSQCQPPTMWYIMNLTVVLGFSLSLSHLWSVVG
jgi:hypothetical protein